MKTVLAICLAACLFSTLQGEETKAPVPPELQALAESLVSAIKTNDTAAISACWHTPEVMAKSKATEAQAEAAIATKEIDVAKETEKELKRRVKDMEYSLHRIGEVRALITKCFGDLAPLKLAELELDDDSEATEAEPAYDNVELHLTAADGTMLTLEIDDAVRIEGSWKFKGRVEDKFSIELSDP
ncbi:MAG: hypothetical protein NTV80_04735 [Verrucomicrobia bacterium]|nr:hypothetical protein [Verrucomicrobiota bacterium]